MRVVPLAALYSSSERRDESSSCSLLQSLFWLSNACDIAPQLTYFERISCSCGVASRPSSSIFRSVRMASTLFRYFVLAPPCPRESSVMRKSILGVAVATVFTSGSFSVSMSGSNASARCESMDSFCSSSEGKRSSDCPNPFSLLGFCALSFFLSSGSSSPSGATF